MCTTCGCGQGETRIEGEGHLHVHADGTVHRHGPQGPARPGRRLLHFGLGAARTSAPGLSQSRILEIEQGVLAKNDGFARANRARFQEQGILALNLVSSPGSGKTALLVETIRRLREQVPLAVIEGDQQTSFDADRIRETGAPAVQINTGRGCHLDARMVGQAAERIALAEGGLLLIENVGNLVCPASFDLGQHLNLILLSVTEGDDKPAKYPVMFRAADAVLISKTDLLPFLDDFRPDQAEARIRELANPAPVFGVSAKTGSGMDAWFAWLRQEMAAYKERLGRSPKLRSEDWKHHRHP